MTEGRRRALLTYRPAIDGLRALAVIAVVIYHMLPEALPGGWFGVDVFFVISGFLITSLLLAEHRTHRGRIDLVAFWRARARRLLPALFLVVAAVLVVAPFVTARGRLEALRLDVLSTLAYAANWRFVFSNEAYFGQIASPSPLRHAWSLAVEEQFYILYPLLLIGLLAVIRRRRTLALVLALIGVASAVLMVVLHEPGLDPSRVYYGTDTRGHQLLAGAAVAAFVSGGPGAVGRGLVRRLDQWCRRLALPAMLVVLSAFWWAGPQQSVLFEGGAVPLSLLITVVLVATTSPSVSLVQTVLAWEPLRRIGVVSYGIYLWHWPIVVFLNDQVLPLPLAARIAVQATLTMLLAWLSHRFVERPIRRHGMRALLPPVPRVSTAVCLTSVPILLVGALLLPAVGQRYTPGTDVADSTVSVPDSDYRPGGSMTSAMLVGNSIPQSLVTTFDSSAHPDLTLVDETNVGCDPLPVPRYADGQEVPDGDSCREWRDNWGEAIRSADPDVVVYFVAQTLVTDRIDGDEVIEFGSREWRDLLTDHLSRAQQAAGDREFAVMNLACHDMPTFNSEESSRVNDFDYVNELNDVVGTWAKRNDVPVIDQYSLLCAGDEYHDVIDGVPLYKDTLHFSDESGPIFWRWLAAELQQITRGDDPS